MHSGMPTTHYAALDAGDAPPLVAGSTAALCFEDVRGCYRGASRIPSLQRQPTGRRARAAEQPGQR